MAIYRSASELIGNTPLLELCGLSEKLGLKGRLLAKLECFNPGGSAKDRVAKVLRIMLTAWAAAQLHDAAERMVAELG